MHSDVDHSRIKTLLRPIFSVFLIFTLYFNIFTTAHAGAAEKWTIEKVVYDDIGKTLNYTASRVNAIARNDYIFNAKVAVDAAKTGSTAASMIKYGLAGAAIIGIVEAAGWVIENGAVVKKKDLADPTKIPNAKFYLKVENVGFQTAYFLTERAAFNYILNLGTSTYLSPYYLKTDIQNYTFLCANPYSNFTNTSCSTGSRSIIWTKGSYSTDKYLYYVSVQNPNYNPSNPPPSIKTEPVTDDELGNAIINSPSAPTVIPDIYSPSNPVPRPSPAPDAVDTALESANPEPRENPKSDIKNKPNSDTDGDGVNDAFDPELPSEGTEFEWVEFCSWAATVCEWYVKYKEDSDLVKEHREKELTFWEKVEEWFDWTKDESGTPDEPDTPEITELDIGQLDTSTFQATAGCPAPIEVPVNIGSGGNVEISYEPICQFAEKWSFVAPLIGFLSGAMILVGVGRKGEDGEL